MCRPRRGPRPGDRALPADPESAPDAAETPAPRTAIARRAAVVASGTLTSRILGLVRDMTFAALFPKAATDLFYIAFTIPNALRALLGEGAVSSAVVPVFSEVRQRDGEEAARRFHARITGVFLVVLAAVAAVGVLAAPALTFAYAAGLRAEPQRFADAVTLTRWLFPYLFFIGLAALGMGGLNALRRFAVPAFAPALLNVALIAAAFSLTNAAVGLGLPAVGALALGALLGGLLQVLAQLPALRSVDLLRWPEPRFGDPDVRKVFRLLTPLLAGLGVYQLNVMLGRLLATFLPAGAPTYLFYGQRLVEVPQGLFAIAIAAAALPTLADLRNRGAHEEALEVFREALRLTLFLAVPSTVGLIVLAQPLVAVLLGRGFYGPAEVLETSRSLVMQAAGVWAIASVRTIIPLFHAHNDTRSPVVASAANLVTFATVGLATMGAMGHVGLALALSAAGVAQLAVLLGLLRRRVGPLGLSSVLGSTARVAVASAALGAVAYAVSLFGDWPRGGNDVRNALVLAGAIAAGAATFFVVAAGLGVREARVIGRLIGRAARRR